ncbi:MAG: mRNA interferase MazF [Solirubrobacterales bacterium]|jgi:mRNA interferase MazF|nr:mRNA interferase MazF [Solirubrobacterales bacterium]MDX6663066.1 mRNA interferase MazF [Solirubrobacterales bacterium]
MALTEPQRGDIWVVSLGTGRPGEPGKNRPAIVMSVDDVRTGAAEDLFVVIPLSSSYAPSALRPRVSPDEGIERPSAAICQGVRALARTRLLRRVGHATEQTVGQIEESLAALLGLEGATRAGAP